MSKRWKAVLFTILPLWLTLSAAMVVSASSSNDAITVWYEARLQESADRIRHSLRNAAYPKGATDISHFTKAKTENVKGVISRTSTDTSNEVMHYIQLHNSQYISMLEQTKNAMLGGIGAQPFEQYVERKKKEAVSSIDEELQLFFQRKLEELGTPVK